MDQDRNLLFGLMAARMGKVSPEQVKKAAAGPVDLADAFVASGTLSAADRAAILRAQEEAIQVHGGDVAATLSDLRGADEVTRALGDSLGLPAAGTDWPSAAGAMSGATVGDSRTTGDARTVLSSIGGSKLDAMPAVQEHAGRYEQREVYASGGMGRILLVHDHHIGRDIALKELLPEQLSAMGSRVTGVPTTDILTIPAFARFVQEAKVTGQLEHPGIVPVYELGYRADGSLYYTMKLVKGRTLQEAITDCKSFQERVALLAHFQDLCQAISYAHSRGVVHRDIKPKNVMVGEFGETVVIDWGIAKARGKKDIHAQDIVHSVEALQGTGSSTVKTMYGQALGSPYFMPPEQAQGRIDEIDERSDVYSLGAVLYTVLTGALPYLGCTVREFLKKVKTESPRPIREIEPEVPAELIAICERAMQRNSADRYQTAKELTDEVSRFMSGGLVKAYEYKFRELLWRFVRKHRTFLITSGVALLVLIAVGVYSYAAVVEQRNLAVEQRNKAVEARAKEEEARKQEEIARKQAQQDLYSANIALTETSLDERRLGEARDLLSRCPEAYRNWEWGRLEYLCNADLMTLKAGGQFVAYLPDGKQLVTASVDGIVALYDATTGELVRTFVEKGGGYSPIVALSADGTRLAVNNDKAVAVWDVASGKEVFSVPQAPDTKHCMAFSADGKRIAARTDDKTVRVWNIEGGEPASIDVADNMGFTTAFAPDGATLLTATAEVGAAGIENRFVLRDAATGAETTAHVVPAPPFVHAVAFSPDGAIVAVGTDAALTLWHVADWSQQAELKTPIYYPGTMAFSPDGRAVAAGGRDDGVLTVWDVVGNAQRFRLTAHANSIHAVAFSPDGRRIVTASSDRLAKVWDAITGVELWPIRGHNGAVFSAAFSPDGTRLATAGYDGATKLWAVDSDLDQVLADAMDYAPARGQLAGSVGNRLVLWDAHNGHALREYTGHAGRIGRVAFAPDGKWLASAAQESDAYVVKLWDVDTGAEARTIKTELPSVDDLAFSPDGRWLAVRSATTLALWDAATGDARPPLAKVDRFRFSPDAALLATGDVEAGVVRLCDAVTGDEKRQFTIAPKSLGIELAFSPDGALFAATNDPPKENDNDFGVRFWNAATGDEAFTLRDLGNHVTAMAFSKDGALLATGHKGGALKLWDAKTHEERFTKTGHAGDVRYVLFNDDATRLVTASDDGTFRMWDVATGRELLTLQNAALTAETDAKPRRAAFSPDGRQLITLTAPRVLPPVVLHSFPATLEAYPGNADTPLQDRIEAYKRGYWEAAKP